MLTLIGLLALCVAVTLAVATVISRFTHWAIQRWRDR